MDAARMYQGQTNNKLAAVTTPRMSTAQRVTPLSSMVPLYTSRPAILLIDGSGGEHNHNFNPVSTGAPKMIQAKQINDQPDDRYEQEADQVADTVMRNHSAPMSEAVAAHQVTRNLSPKTGASAPSNIGALSTGYPLSMAVRTRFENVLGWDFSGVRLHSDTVARQTADSIGAKAFTTGRDIVFGSNIDNPEGSMHHRVLAHELSHVVQQDKGASAQLGHIANSSSFSQPVAARLSAAPIGRVQAMPTVTGINVPTSLGVGRSITATALVAPGTRAGMALNWTLVGAPAGVTYTQRGREATIHASGASLAGAGASFTIRCALRTTPGDNATSANITLIGITAITFTATPAFTAIAALGGPYPFPPGTADPNRGGLTGNKATVNIVTAPVGRATTITLLRSLGAAVAGNIITPGATTGNIHVRVTDNATGIHRDTTLTVNPVPVHVHGLTPAGRAPSPYGERHRVNFASSDSTGVLNRIVGETITARTHDDFGIIPTINGTGPNPAPNLGQAVPANHWIDRVFSAAGANAGAAGDANKKNVNRFVGPGVAVSLPAITDNNQGFHFMGWVGTWGTQFDLGMHRRTLLRQGVGFIYRIEHIFPGGKAPTLNEPYVGPPLIILSRITTAPRTPPADGATLVGVTVHSTVPGRKVNWSVLGGGPALTFTAGAAAAPVAAAATLRTGLVPGTFNIRVTDTVFPNRRAEGTIRLLPVTISAITARRTTIPRGSLTAFVSLVAHPAGRNINWTVDAAATASGVTLVRSLPSAAAILQTARITRPPGFTGSVTVTATDSVLATRTNSIIINFK